ncbi:MAG TPA: hypothetical protein VMY77_18520 [Chitinophagaceae bacterium]|nr:hypothetical protein [Chitinophagaceae bacterium]
MLKELFDLVKNHATETVVNNPDVPNEHNDAVVAEATNTVASGLRNVVAGGGIQSLLSLFGSGGGDKKSLLSNPIVSMMMGHFAGKLMNKFGLNNNQANNVSGNLIPDVLSSLINKTNKPNGSGFSLENILGSITGNKNGNADQSSGGGGIGDLLKQFTGSGQGNGNGGGGVMDIIKSLAGGAQQQQQQNGNLLDIIKGFAK